MSKFTPVVHRALGNYDPMVVSNMHALDFGDEPSLTVQSDAIDADINTIVRRFGITGQMPESIVMPSFQDFGDNVFDFRSAVETLAMAEDAFMQIPAEVRAKFANDPHEFMKFCFDPKNADEMLKLGLRVEAPEKPEPAPLKVQVVNDAPKS